MKLLKALFYLVTTLHLTYVVKVYAEEPRNDAEQLRHIKEVLWPKAYKEQNVALLDSILDSSFQLITSEGARSSKADELAALPDFLWPHTTFSYDIHRLDIYSEQFAIVAGEGRATGENGKGEYCFKYQSSNVLHKKGANWQGVLSHVSGVTEC